MRRAVLSVMFAGLILAAGCVTRVVEVPASEPAPPPATASAETMRLRFSAETRRNFEAARWKGVYVTEGESYSECSARLSFEDQSPCQPLYPAEERKRKEMAASEEADWVLAQTACVEFDAGMTIDEVLTKLGVPISGQITETQKVTVLLVGAAVYQICPEHTLKLPSK